MLVDTKSATKRFFSKSSLEWVYFEAIANSIDAGARNIDVSISIDSVSLSGTLEIVITDDGCGIDDSRFEKFRKLLKTERDDRKGVGRLMYLNYFDEVQVESHFGSTLRKFTFNEDFEGQKVDAQVDGDVKTGTTLTFKHFNNSRIAKQNYYTPTHLKEVCKKQFYPSLIAARNRKEVLNISFNCSIGGGATFTDTMERSAILSSDELPEFQEVEIDVQGFDSLFPFRIKHAVEELRGKSALYTLVAVDGRTVEIDVVSKTKLPKDYCFVFIIESDALQGKSDNARLILDISPIQMQSLKNSFLKSIRETIENRLPEIQIENQKRIEEVEEKYPHLKGYFIKDEVGLLDNSKVIESAQKRFFNDEKYVFETSDLTDELFEKSLNHSSRLLLQYVLHRLKIINKLKSIKERDLESTIHDLLVPKSKVFRGENCANDVFANNAWVIDDKFMNYRVILSDIELTQIYPEIGDASGRRDSGKPDITVICSNSLDSEEKVDVVIVELKRLGVGEDRNSIALNQLRQRARKLLEYRPEKIQRIWFYAIVDIDKDFDLHLRETKHISLYSNGSVYYQEYEIIIAPDGVEKTERAQVFIMDYKALIEDAEARNHHFMEVLKKGFIDAQEQESVEELSSEEILIEEPDDVTV
jgi:hypothetical protein